MSWNHSPPSSFLGLRKTHDLLYDVAFSPLVLEECVKQVDLVEMLVSLCLDYVENETDLKIADRKDCKKVGLGVGLHTRDL